MPEPDEPIPMPAPGRKGGELETKADTMIREREVEREEGIAPDRRGSHAAPSDKPEAGLPHPQDVTDISDD